MVNIPIELVRNNDEDVPFKMTYGAAGHDLKAAIQDPLLIKKGEVLLVPCGIKIAIPEGWVGLVCPRSGLALKHKITVFNSPGVIDSDYRGQVHVMLINHGEDYTIQPGERIGQILFVKYDAALFSKEALPAVPEGTGSRTGGFGSTGKV